MALRMNSSSSYLSNSYAIFSASSMSLSLMDPCAFDYSSSIFSVFFLFSASDSSFDGAGVSSFSTAFSGFAVALSFYAYCFYMNF